MSYTDGTRAPRPTQSEKRFANMSDVERESMSIAWLEQHLREDQQRRLPGLKYIRTAEQKP